MSDTNTSKPSYYCYVSPIWTSGHGTVGGKFFPDLLMTKVGIADTNTLAERLEGEAHG